MNRTEKAHDAFRRAEKAIGDLALLAMPMVEPNRERVQVIAEALAKCDPLCRPADEQIIQSTAAVVDRALGEWEARTSTTGVTHEGD